MSIKDGITFSALSYIIIDNANGMDDVLICIGLTSLALMEGLLYIKNKYFNKTVIKGESDGA